MNILLYIEPYPLRNEMDHLRDVAASFARMLVDASDHPDFEEHDIRIYGNHEILNRAQEASFAAKRFLLWPDGEEMDLFRTGLTDWDTGGIAGWRDLLRGEGHVAIAYFAVLEAVRERFPFDLIVHWGENGAVRLFSELRDVQRVAITPGCLRPPLMDSFIIDAGGSGARGLPACVPIKELIEATEDVAWPAAADLNAVTGTAATGWADTLYGAVNFSGCEHILTRGDQRAAYVPLHPHDDPDFLAHSGFDTPADFLRDVIVPLAEKNLLVAVRPEAACWETPGGDSAMAEAKSAVSHLPDRILWLDPRSEPVSSLQLLNLTDGVIAANGPFAFQALLFEKPVSLVGETFYKPEGVFFRPEDIAAGRYHRKSYPEAIQALRTFILRAGLVHREDVFDFSTFIGRVLDTAANQERLQHSPVQVVQEVLAASGPREPVPELMERSAEPSVTVPEEPAESEQEEPKQDEPDNSPFSFFGKIMERAGLPLLNGTEGHREEDAEARPPAEDVLEAPTVPNVFPLSDDERDAIELAKELLKTRTRRKRKLAVILHCYYRDTTRRLLEQLKRIPGSYDLICTVPEFAAGVMEPDILKQRPSALVVPLPNRGEHIWPFLFVLQELGTEKYETVLKLHTKRHFDPGRADSADLGAAWLDYALACLLGAEASAERVKKLLKSRPAWSLAGPSGLYVDASGVADQARTELQAAGLNPPEEWARFAGAMFWADPQMFACLLPELSDPERYAAPETLYPHAFTETAETLLTAVSAFSKQPVAGLLPNTEKIEHAPDLVPMTFEDIRRTTLRLMSQ